MSPHSSLPSLNTAMTSIPIATLIAEGYPLTPKDWNEEKEQKRRVELERVRQLCAEQYSSSPSWQKRLAKNPNFFKTFSPGGIR